MGLNVERIETEAGLRKLAPAWNALFAQSETALPFQTHAWTERWWSHLREDRPGLRDHLKLRAVWDGKELVAVAPLVLTERPGVGPLRVRYLHFIGADPNMTELRGVLVPQARADAVYRALLDDLEDEGGWDWIRWTGLRPGSEVLDPKLELRLPHNPCFVLPLPESWEALRARLKPNLKEALRKCYKLLSRENKQHALQVARTPAEVAGAVERFLHLHRARAQVDDGVRHDDIFARPVSRRFLRDVCQRLAECGCARVFELAVDGEVVASRVGFEFPGQLYLYFSGYDPRWARYSVMTTTIAEILKYAIDAKLPMVNLSTGSDPSKLRWEPVELAYGDGIQFARSERSRLVFEAFRRAQTLRHHPAVRSSVGPLLARRSG